MKQLSNVLVIWIALAPFAALAGKEECMSAFAAKDYGRAFQECQGPAREGDVSSQHAMAKMYFQGAGVKQNFALAAEWTRKVAEQGDTAAQCVLGSMYAEGHGVTRNQAEAVIWYRRAAEGGEPSCQIEMSKLASEAKNPAEAFDWRLRAAKQGYAPAQLYVGLSYLIGESVEKNSPEGEQWIRRAAVAGDPDAQYFLGTMLVDGTYGKQDPQEGELWLRRSAAQGYAKAKEVLAKRGVQEPPMAGQPRKLTCEDGRSLKNTYTPLDLYSVMPDCMAKKLYQEAGDIYALAGVYGYFDRLRVRDRSAHQAVSVLAMTFGAKLTEEFREYLKTITNGEGLIQLCGKIRKIGMPDYFPHYMVSHGLGSHQAALKGEAPAHPLYDTNPVEIWNHALDKYLHCPS